MANARPLTPKQAAFVAEYMVDLCGKEAAIRAGYSPRSAVKLASQLLDHPGVRAAIERAQAARAVQTARTALDVLTDIRDVTTKARDAGQYKVALRGLELEGKHLGMFTERVEMSGNLHISALIEEARSRVRNR